MVNPLQLVRFAAVAEHLSFTEAARDLGIDQATLSRQIRQLELDLGFALLTRTTRTVALTARGEALLPAALDLARADKNARRKVSELVSLNESVLRFGMHPFVYWSLDIKSILDRFIAANPDASVTSSSGMSHRQLMRIRSRHLDVALVLDCADMAGFESMPLLETTPNLLLPEEHELVAKPELRITDMRGINIAISQPGRDREDFDRVYGPFLNSGAGIHYVSEGTAAVSFRAATERLSMISLRSINQPAPLGFVRREVIDGHRVRFILIRLASEDRGITNRLWNCAHQILRN